MSKPGGSSKSAHMGVEIDTCAFQTGCYLSSAASGMSLGLWFYTISVAWRVVLDSWRCCLSLGVVVSFSAGSTMINQFLCGFICVSLCQNTKFKPTTMFVCRLFVCLNGECTASALQWCRSVWICSIFDRINRITRENASYIITAGFEFYLRGLCTIFFSTAVSMNHKSTRTSYQYKGPLFLGKWISILPA